MKKINIGINGFGRIGRLILRKALEKKNVQVCMINDPNVTVDYAVYMLKYDTIHGTLKADISFKDNFLIVNGNKILFTNEREIGALNWKKAGVDIVAECTGVFTTKEKASEHITLAGAKKVVISAPGKNGVDTFVFGVNHTMYAGQEVISNASCTTNCLAPLAKIIDDKFGIERGLMTTVHSYTATQPIVDGASKKDWRGGRAGAQNIIPSSTGAAKAVGEVLPHLKGKLTGCSVRVPTANVSLVILDVILKKPTTYDEICSEMQKRAEGDMKGIVKFCDELVVSSDFIGEEATCVFDKRAGIALDSTMFKLFAWYDNEWGYSCKMLDLICHIAK